MTVLAIVGPTAAGKSGLALEVAERCGGEIINADSMQLYRGMDIGTAKLAPAERRGIPHHLLDIWPVTHPADVASYQTQARERIDALLLTGRLPILVGGSGLYLRAALDEFEFPATDPAVRAALEAELAVVGPETLHRRLVGADPTTAGRIHPSNGRKIVRALEVISLGGSFRAALPLHTSHYDTLLVGVDVADPAELDARIDQRAAQMWAAGFVDEVRGLLPQGLREGRTASRALGYAQVLQFLDGRLPDEAAALAETARATRRFARRQRSWFRPDPRIRWGAWSGDAVAELLHEETSRRHSESGGGS